MERSLVEQLEEQSKKAERYDHIKDKYLCFDEKIKSAISILQEIVDEMNTGVKITIQRCTGIKFSELQDEWYEKIQKGMRVTCKMIQSAYPEWDIKSVHYLFTKLRKSKGVVVIRNPSNKGRAEKILFMDGWKPEQKLEIRV